MAHLSISPSAIFSPTVARQQQATAKDWNYIDSWLFQKYNNKTPPAFERNAETLKTLLALASLNESADEERELLTRMEAKTLSDLHTAEASNPNKELLASLEEALTTDGKTSLEALANLSVVLDEPLPDTRTLAQKIVELHIASADLAQTTERVTIMQTQLANELSRLNNLVADLRSAVFLPPSELPQTTQDFQRRVRNLAAQIPAMRERVAARGEVVTFEEVQREEERYRALKVTVSELERQVKGFHGLPQDTDLARLELEGVRVELRDLAGQRDSMFEGLVERETPRKPRR